MITKQQYMTLDKKGLNLTTEVTIQRTKEGDEVAKKAGVKRSLFPDCSDSPENSQDRFGSDNSEDQLDPKLAKMNLRAAARSEAVGQGLSQYRHNLPEIIHHSPVTGLSALDQLKYQGH